jgi:hypothetical protein
MAANVEHEGGGEVALTAEQKLLQTSIALAESQKELKELRASAAGNGGLSMSQLAASAALANNPDAMQKLSQITGEVDNPSKGGFTMLPLASFTGTGYGTIPPAAAQVDVGKLDTTDPITTDILSYKEGSSSSSAGGGAMGAFVALSGGIAIVSGLQGSSPLACIFMQLFYHVLLGTTAT